MEDVADERRVEGLAREPEDLADDDDERDERHQPVADDQRHRPTQARRRPGRPTDRDARIRAPTRLPAEAEQHEPGDRRRRGGQREGASDPDLLDRDTTGDRADRAEQVAAEIAEGDGVRRAVGARQVERVGLRRAAAEHVDDAEGQAQPEERRQAESAPVREQPRRDERHDVEEIDDDHRPPSVEPVDEAAERDRQDERRQEPDRVRGADRQRRVGHDQRDPADRDHRDRQPGRGGRAAEPQRRVARHPERGQGRTGREGGAGPRSEPA